MKASRHFIAAILLASASTAFAANIAVVDSGVDYKHVDLSSKMWHNPNGSTKTDDGTSYEQDTHGWNFADKNNEIIDYKYLGTFSADCTKIFEVQGRILMGTATDEDRAWYNAKKNDQTFLKELGKFGNFVHGSHVSGISSKDVAKAQLIAMKIIPTETPGQLTKFKAEMARRGISFDDTNDPMVMMYLNFIAQQQANMLISVGNYVKAVHSDVANGSFGISVKAAEPIVENLLKQLGKSPTPEDTHAYTVYLIQQILEQSKPFVTNADHTLYVFAAGNDGTDNDAQPASPANIKVDNSISVAATMGVSKLASFSNYGATLVEVAAPGVVITSSIPGDQHLAMSGTSMAAPFVTNAAARVKDANPAFGPAQIKKVLMETVDVKDWLKGKVSTSGIVNQPRAVRAAELATTMSLTAAIGQARLDVADISVDAFMGGDDQDLLVVPLPSTLR